MNKPEKKKSPKGHGCQCGAYTYAECGCDVSWEDNDGYNKAIEEYDKYHEAILCEKDKEILESRNKVKMLKGMAAELSGCYDMDTAILHKEIFELREEIKSLKLGLEDEELFNNIDKA